MSAAVHTAMMEAFLASLVVPNLAHGESVLYATRIALNKTGFVLAKALFGFSISRYNVGVLTTQRLLVLDGKTGMMLEQHDWRAFVACRRGGLGNNRSLTFVRSDGTTLGLEIWLRVDRLTDQFFHEVPELIGARLPAGARVSVAGADGQRHDGTIAQYAAGHYLCQMPDGAYYWFPDSAVTAG